MPLLPCRSCSKTSPSPSCSPAPRYIYAYVSNTLPLINPAQLPLYSLRSDGVGNFLGALVMAAHYPIAEVAIFCNNKLVSDQMMYLRGACMSSRGSCEETEQRMLTP